MNHEEALIQCEIVKVLQAAGIYFHMVPNDAAGSNRIRQMQMVSMGLRAGVADLCVWWPLIIGYMEVKKPGGVQSDNQKKFEARCKARNIPYDIVYSVSDVEKLIKKYA